MTTPKKPTSKPTDPGTNRTGIAASPVDAERVQESAVAGTMADGAKLQETRIDYARQADPIGSMPPPATVKGVAKTILSAIKGRNPLVFLDKLGERLAFERGGVRLYDALLVKLEAAHVHPGGPTRAELEKIRDDELRHFGLLVDAMRDLGGDPTAMTPCADAIAVASSGLVQLLTEPRITLSQALTGILTAELADNEGWELLASLAEDLDQGQLAARFRMALSEEADHLARVRLWLRASVEGQAGVGEEQRAPPPPAP